MSEEEKGKMDRKSNPRQCSPMQKNGADIKKDLSSRNQRWGKRHGNNSSGNVSYNEGQGKKTTPQKYKNTSDKRPRPRGELPDRTRGDLEEHYDPDFGAVTGTRSRKVNLNHLLNFYDEDSYRRRAGGARGGWNSRTRSTRGYRSGGYPRGGKMYYNKEQFLQANCQFVVKEVGDYSAHLIDPDTLVDWDSIEQVRVLASESPSCPICLDVPTAGKMTRCGHIFCWPCILHYLAVGEKTWRKCPICYESVHSDDLKSVVSRQVTNYKVGDTISLTLMKKEKGSIYAVPANMWCAGDGKTQCHNVQESEGLTRHVKLMTARTDQVLQQLEREAEELMVQLALAESSEEPFIKGAQEQLQAKMAKLLLITKPQETKVKEEDPIPEEEPPAPTMKRSPSDKKIKIYKSAFSDEENEIEKEESSPVEPALEMTVTSEALDDGVSQAEAVAEATQESTPRSSLPSETSDTEDGQPPDSAQPLPDPQPLLDPKPLSDPQPPEPLEMLPDALPVEEAAEQLELPTQPESATKRRVCSGDNCFYFYQCEEGQHIYLHSLNARCLVREYGSLENSPQTVTATIVEKEGVFMSEELRQRLRYLNHLPLTCGFEVVELNMKPPLIGKETIKHFTEDIEKRRRQRQRRNRDDKRMARRIEEEERKKFGISNSTIIPSQFGRPNVPTDRRVSETRSDTSSPSLDTPYGSPDVGVAECQATGGADGEDGSQTSVVSFAQMLKGGTKAAPVWPKKQCEGVSAGSARGRGRDSEGEESDNEDKVPVPEYQSSFGSAIEAALVNMDSRTEEADPSKASGSKSGGKKKKKLKQLVLFSTSMARGGGK